jgi:hypothetical protein
MTDTLDLGTCGQCGDSFAPPPPGAGRRYAAYDARAYLCNPCRTAFYGERDQHYAEARDMNVQRCREDGHKPFTTMTSANLGLPWCSRCRFGLLPNDGTRLPSPEENPEESGGYLGR